MSADVYTAVNGHRVTRLVLTVASVGPWFAEVDFEADPEREGAAELVVGDLKCKGTFVDASNGTHGLQRKARLVGGAGGWSSTVSARSYHNDAGVKARVVAEDAAREVGETLAAFVPAAERVGRDYARQQGPASLALEDVIGGVPWWVDYDGLTHVGTRATSTPDAKAYEVLAYDPRDRVVTLAVDDPSKVGIGSVLAERLDEPQTIRSFELRVSAEEMRVVAWCGGDVNAHDRLTGLLRAIARRSTDESLFGAWRYRVVQMAGDRVDLQAVRKDAGLPDLRAISMWPGVAGVHAELAPGAEVLVSFVEGDRAQPIVTHYAGKDGNGFVPVSLTLGGPSGAPVARQGDLVEVTLLPGAFSGTVNGAAAAGTITFGSPSALGVITGGSTKVRAAS